MKARSLVSLIIAATVVWTVADVDARRGRKARRGQRQQTVMEALDLTAEQQEKLKSLRLDNAKRMARLRADLKVARLDLQAITRQDNPDAAEVKTGVAKVNQARSLILETRVGHRLKVNQVLTPEQQDKLREHRRGRPDRGRRMWRRGGRYGSPQNLEHRRPERKEERSPSG